MSVRARKSIITVVTKAAAYDTILRPIITEKAIEKIKQRVLLIITYAKFTM